MLTVWFFGCWRNFLSPLQFERQREIADPGASAPQSRASALIRTRSKWDSAFPTARGVPAHAPPEPAYFAAGPLPKPAEGAAPRRARALCRSSQRPASVAGAAAPLLPGLRPAQVDRPVGGGNT